MGGGRSRGPTPLFPGANSGNPPAARAPSRGAAGGAAGGSPGMRGRWPALATAAGRAMGCVSSSVVTRTESRPPPWPVRPGTGRSRRQRVGDTLSPAHHHTRADSRRLSRPLARGDVPTEEARVELRRHLIVGPRRIWGPLARPSLPCLSPWRGAPHSPPPSLRVPTVPGTQVRLGPGRVPPQLLKPGWVQGLLGQPCELTGLQGLLGVPHPHFSPSSLTG